jgi:hypothetical protein
VKGEIAKKPIDKFYGAIKIKTKIIEKVNNFENVANYGISCSSDNRVFTDKWMHARQ